jgi:hypothetical protein
VRLSRKLRNGRRLALATTVRSVRRAGVVRLALSTPPIRRALRAGEYEIEGTPGASRTRLGTSSRFRFKVIDG